MEHEGTASRSTLRRVVPWVAIEEMLQGDLMPTTTASTAPAMLKAPSIAKTATPATDAVLTISTVSALVGDAELRAMRPGWAIGGFPASVDELLEQRSLQHLADRFKDESIIDLALYLSAYGSEKFLRRLEELGVAKVGERHQLLNALTRATQALQISAASLLDPLLEKRIAAMMGPNLRSFVATFPRSETAAVAAVATNTLSIAGVINAIFNDTPGVEALQQLLQQQELEWLTDTQVSFARSACYSPFSTLLPALSMRAPVMHALGCRSAHSAPHPSA